MACRKNVASKSIDRKKACRGSSLMEYDESADSPHWSLVGIVSFDMYIRMWSSELIGHQSCIIIFWYFLQMFAVKRCSNGKKRNIHLEVEGQVWWSMRKYVRSQFKGKSIFQFKKGIFFPFVTYSKIVNGFSEISRQSTNKNTPKNKPFAELSSISSV